jgi:hypothetical protein
MHLFGSSLMLRLVEVDTVKDLYGSAVLHLGKDFGCGRILLFSESYSAD